MTIPQPTFDAAREAAYKAFNRAYHTTIRGQENAVDAAITAAQVEWEKPLRKLAKELRRFKSSKVIAHRLESMLATVRGGS